MKTKRFTGSKYSIVNTETGEIMNNEDSLITVNYDEDDGIVNGFMRDEPFLKCFKGHGAMLSQLLTSNEAMTLMSILDYMCYDDCVLRAGAMKSGRPLWINDLAKIRGCAPDTMRKIINNLKDKQIVGIHQTGDPKNNTIIKMITINPYIFFRGHNLNSWVRDFYKDSQWNTTKS